MDVSDVFEDPPGSDVGELLVLAAKAAATGVDGVYDVGLIARGVVFGMMGLFLVRAALQRDPSEAGGLGEALQELARQPYAPVVLGGVALGLAAYGAYQLALARWAAVPTAEGG